MLNSLLVRVKNYFKQVKEQKALSLCKPISIHFKSKKDIVPLHILTIILPTIGIGVERSFSYEHEQVLITEFPTQLTVRRIPQIRYTMICISFLGFGIAFSRQLDY